MLAARPKTPIMVSRVSSSYRIAKLGSYADLLMKVRLLLCSVTVSTFNMVLERGSGMQGNGASGDTSCADLKRRLPTQVVRLILEQIPDQLRSDEDQK